MFIEEFTDEEQFELRLTLERQQYIQWFGNGKIHPEYKIIGYATVNNTKITRDECLCINGTYYIQIRNYPQLRMGGTFDHYFLMSKKHNVSITNHELDHIKKGKYLKTSYFTVNPKINNVH